MQFQNRILLTIQISKPFTFGHLVVLLGHFDDVADTCMAVEDSMARLKGSGVVIYLCFLYCK